MIGIVLGLGGVDRGCIDAELRAMLTTSLHMQKASAAGQIGFIPGADGHVTGVTYSLWNGVKVLEHYAYHGVVKMSMGYTHTVFNINVSTPSPAPPPPPPPAGNPWVAGWGFASHQGVPAMQPFLQSYHLNKSVVGYFVANYTGLDSASEVAEEVKLGIVGIGWELDHSTTSVSGGLELYEAQQAAALKAARPDVGIMLLRDTEVVTTFWTAFRDAMNDTDLWLQSPPGSGKPISEPWGSTDPHAGGPTPKYFLNFSNPKTQEWWLNKYIGPAFEDPNIDGVYTDCSCGNARGYTPTAAELAGRQAAFDQALILAKSKGKWMSSWEGAAVVKGPEGAGESCAEHMDAIIALGADPTRGMQLRNPRGQPGVVLQNTVAAFLLARGESAVIVLPAYDRPMTGTQFKMEGVPNANADPGKPVGPATKVGTGANAQYSRSYTNAEVTLNCVNYESTIVFK